MDYSPFSCAGISNESVYNENDMYIELKDQNTVDE